MKITDNLPEHRILSITHNEHRDYYFTILKYLQRDGADGFEKAGWVSRADFDAAVENDSLWRVRWHTKLPCYFVVYGSTLENALMKANETD